MIFYYNEVYKMQNFNYCCQLAFHVAESFIPAAAGGDKSAQMRMKLFLPYYHIEGRGSQHSAVVSQSASLKMVIFSAIMFSRACSIW